MEKTFSLPGDLTYQKTGVAMASRIVLASTQFQVTDPNFAQSVHSFVQQCVFYDVLLHKYSWNDLFICHSHLANGESNGFTCPLL